MTRNYRLNKKIDWIIISLFLLLSLYLVLGQGSLLFQVIDIHIEVYKIFIY